MVTVVIVPSKRPVGDVSNLPFSDVLVSVTPVNKLGSEPVTGWLAESCNCTVMTLDATLASIDWAAPAENASFTGEPVMAKTVVAEVSVPDAAVIVGSPTTEPLPKKLAELEPAGMTTVVRVPSKGPAAESANLTPAGVLVRLTVMSPPVVTG